MAFTYKSDAIILKRWDYKEQDRMVRLLTRDFGKITCRAISARKLESKLAGHLEPFIHTQAFFARSKTIDIIAGSNTITANERLRQSLSHYASAGAFVEIVDRWVQERDTDVPMFDHVRAFLHWLNTHNANAIVFVGAVLQMFEMLGYCLGLYRCHRCQQLVTPVGITFHLQLWNVECADCRDHEETIPLTEELLKSLRFLMENDFDTIARLRISTQTWEDLYRFLRTLIHYHTGAELRSDVIFSALLRA